VREMYGLMGSLHTKLHGSVMDNQRSTSNSESWIRHRR
jgi:hypothetical protein